jgi:methyltransferase-like protein/cyclopropane fatty-acyl-phospholipid synthase-like methyltransferase
MESLQTPYDLHLPEVPTAASSTASDTSYDEIPYGSHAIPGSHPDRLFSIARLFSVDAVPPSEAKILELGCAGGGNLIPIASQFPKARCVGVELSAVQVENAKIAIRYANLDNVEVIQGSITEIGPELGTFDYILCHGVYSWVPDAVRESILRTTAQNLSHTGVAFISCNTLPGWHFRGMIREMMLRHTAGIPDNRTKILQARALLDFLSVSTQKDASPYATYLRQEAAKLNVFPDEYIFHEYLESINNAYYFQDFAKAAARWKLKYLADSNLPSIWIGNLPPEAAAKLGSIPDPILQGHYMDCLAGRSFRENLLVHDSVSINRNPLAGSMSGIRFSGQFTPHEEGEAPGHNPKPGEKSYLVKQKIARTADKLAQAMMETLHQNFPLSLDIDEILSEVEKRIQLSDDEKNNLIRKCLQELYQWSMMGLVNFQFHPDRAAYRGIPKPKATNWARAQAEAGSTVTTLQHRLQQLTANQRLIMPFLTGLNSIADLASHMSVLLRTGAVEIEPAEEINKHSDKFSYDLTVKTLNELAALHLLQA